MRNLFSLLFIVGLMSCGDDVPTQAEQLDEFMNNNPSVVLDTMVTANGDFYFAIEATGGAEKPTPANMVTVTYQGTYTDGELFDANTNITFPLGNTILGWQFGIPLVGKNGSLKLVIPPNLAYGPNPNNSIRKNAVLVFDVDLHDFN
jgi:FKBP-type peptidyl-prolyl cis-trans isomerase